MKTIGKWCKRLCTGVLVMVLLLCALPLSAFAADENTGILFQDDFSDTSGGWEPYNGNWVIEDGVYKETTGSNSGAMTYVGDTTWADYEVEVTVSNFNPSNYIMVCGRVQDVKNRYIASYTGTQLIIDRRIDGQSTVLAAVDYKLSADTPVTMTFRCVGDSLSAYIDGELVVEATDSTHATGKIGLATFKTTAYFDDLTVRAITDGLDVVSMPKTVANYQVIQRNTATQSATLPLSGQVTDEVTSVEAAVLNYADDTVVVDWTPMTVSNGNYSGSLTVPQGGWYKLAIRAKDAAGNELKSLTGSNRFGVGINILCIGQSNMVGQGTGTATTANDLVANFRGGVWSHLVDPYDGAGTSLVPVMANKLVEELGLPIGIIPAGDSGSGLHAPNPSMNHGEKWCWIYYNESDHADTSTLYGRALSRARSAGGVELAVWNQGETDGYIKIPKDTYKADMVTLLNRFRTDLGNATLPMFLCQIGPHAVKDGFDDAAYTEIRSAQNELDDGENFYMAATEMEVPQKSDGVHYTTEGLNTIGQRVANGILYHYGKSTYYRGPYITSATFAVATNQVVDVEITHRGGNDITPDSGITGFTVATDGQDVLVTSAVKLDADTIRLTLSAPLENGGSVRYLYGLVPDVTNVVKDNTALTLPMEATVSDIAINEISGGDEEPDEPDTPVEDNISFTTAAGAIVYPVDKLVGAERYTTSKPMNLGYNVTKYATMPAGVTDCTYYAFPTDTIGDYVEFTLPVEKAGVYTLSVESYAHSNRGSYQASWGDGVTGGVYSQKIVGQDNSDVATRVLPHTHGFINASEPGEVTVRFKATVAGTIAFCNIILTPYENKIDDNGVVTFPLSEINKTTSVIPNVTETVTVDGEQMDLVAYPTVAGDTVAVTLPLKGVKPGAYALSVTVERSSNRGKYSITPGDGLMVPEFVDTAKAVVNNQWNGSKSVITHSFYNVLVGGQDFMDLTIVVEQGGVTELGILSINLTPIEGRYPIELLTFKQETTTSQVPYEYAVRHERNYLLARMAKAGEYVEFTLPSVQPGLYQIGVTSYTDATFRGTYQLYANGEAIGSPISQVGTSGTYRLDISGNVAVTDVTDLKVRLQVTALGGGTGALALNDIQLIAQPVDVTFVGKYQETVAEKQVTSLDDLIDLMDTITAPALGGYRFVAWDCEDAAMLFGAAVASGEAISLNAVYEVDTNTTYDVTVTDATANKTDDLTFDTRVTVTADIAPTYWDLDGAKVGFGQKSYTFYVSGNNAITAVYDEAAVITPDVVLQQTAWSSNGERYNLTVVAQTSIPSDVTYTDLTYGVYYTSSEATIQDLSAGGAYLQVQSSKSAGNQQYMTHLLSVAEGKNRFARAYMQYTVDGETVTLFSDRYVKFETAAIADGVGDVTVTSYTLS